MISPRTHKILILTGFIVLSLILSGCDTKSRPVEYLCLVETAQNVYPIEHVIDYKMQRNSTILYMNRYSKQTDFIEINNTDVVCIENTNGQINYERNTNQ